LPERSRSFKRPRLEGQGSEKSDEASAESLDGTPEPCTEKSLEEAKMGSDFLAYYEHESSRTSGQLTRGDSAGDTPSDTEDDEIDLAKTKESLWSLFTGGF
jgi:hypothetical protein